MAKKKNLTESMSVNYYCRDSDTGEDVRRIDMSWENRPIEDVVQNLNTWLNAIGYPVRVIQTPIME